MTTKIELSEACRKHLAARWDDGHAMNDDERFFDAVNSMEEGAKFSVIEIELEDMLDFPELRTARLTAVAISQDGQTYYTTDEESEDDD